MPKAVTLFLFVAAAVLAGSTEQGARLRIGVLDLENIGPNKQIAAPATDRLQQIIATQGMVEIFGQVRLQKELARVGKKMPLHCRDPRCVLDIGGMINLDRMVYGTVDANDKRCGVHLYLLDVVMRQSVSETSIEGEAGVPIDSILSAAVANLYGRTTGKTMKKYFGPEVHNEKQMLYSTGAVIGVGVIWGLVNFNQSNKGTLLATENRNEPLSGIPSSADQIPMFARPAALANAYVAASDDAYGVLYNPAGIAWVTGPEAICGYQYRFGLNNIAASYVNKATREIGFGQALLYSGDKEGLLTETYLVSAVAYKFNQLFSFARPLSFGLNLKMMSDLVRGNDPSSVSGGSFGAGLDLGLLTEFSENIRYGLLLRDVPIVNQWKNISTGERYGESPAMTLHMGGSYRSGYTTFLIAEGKFPVLEGQSWEMAGGIEQELFRVIMMRVGLQKAIQKHYDTPWKITGGLGMNAGPLGLDGSYEYNTLKVFEVVNVSVRWKF